ncbi:putative polar flagellar assembly protein FliJ, partial [Vibrio parahaemolyticus AQ3810]
NKSKTAKTTGSRCAKNACLTSG